MILVDASGLSHQPVGDAFSLPIGFDLSDFDITSYSKGQIARVGRLLAGPVPWDESRKEELSEAFRIAHSWRFSHEVPMRKMRQELIGKARVAKSPAITAARLKRMLSVRKKLRRQPSMKLYQIQDIGGCRAIVDTIEQADAIRGIYLDGGSRFPLVGQGRSYIDTPKPGGYRSHHLVLEYAGSGVEEALSGRRIELQIRTKLQHAWATAVEAIGLSRSEDLKAGEGDKAWLRLFELVSSDFAAAEGRPPVPGAPSEIDRRNELIDLDGRLKAISTLENLNRAFKETEGYIPSGAKYFLIQYDHSASSVKISGYSAPLFGGNDYALRESSAGSVEAVLVEVDRVESLREAYPNYYLDVRLFAQNLRNIISGKKLDLMVEGVSLTPASRRAAGSFGDALMEAVRHRRLKKFRGRGPRDS